MGLSAVASFLWLHRPLRSDRGNHDARFGGILKCRFASFCGVKPRKLAISNPLTTEKSTPHQWLGRFFTDDYFAGEKFSLVDAVFAPIFRYFDVFDEFTDLAVFKDMPKVRKWRAELAKRSSVKAAVGVDYPQSLRAFLRQHDAHLLKLAA
ncbi:glutathione binding-like protein [Bradyrhizobium sp. Ai1a-2]|uniref:glutathione binding-like protein n=1 Tax=Bradyrhizobium sp. Ai1a-2 TaxID=196490 RepID=UPI0031B87A6C